MNKTEKKSHMLILNRYIHNFYTYIYSGVKNINNLTTTDVLVFQLYI